MVTIKDKILLHLLENYEDNLLCTRKAVANAIGVDTPQISRAVGVLLRRKFIEKGKVYVEDTGRFRDFYSPTLEGMERAKKICERVGERKIIVLKKGKKEEKRIKEVEGKGMVETLRDLSDNVLDLSRRKELITVLKGAPEVRYFFGREKELALIDRFINSPASLLCIRGIAGIGKSTLGAKVAKKYSPTKNIFWYKVNEWSSLGGLVKELGNFLAKLRKSRLRSYLVSAKKLEVDELSFILERDLENSLLFFDDCHLASSELKFLLKSLLTLSTKKIKLILLGRQTPRIYDRKAVTVDKRVVEMELGGLSAEASKKVLAVRKVNKNRIPAVLSLTHYHPLFLEIVDPKGALRSNEISQYLREEIFLKLKREEKEALQFATVFKEPFPIEVFTENEIPYGIAEALVAKSLLYQCDGEYMLHTVIKENLYPKLTRKQREKYHLKAAEYYRIKDPIQYMYHLVNGGKEKECVTVAIAQGEGLVREGRGDELMHLLDLLDIREGGEELGEILILRGNILALKGELDEALSCYERAESMVKDVSLGKAYRYIGDIHRRRNRWEGALRNYKKALELSKRVKDTSGMADAYRNIGRIWWGKGKWKEAMKFLRQSIALVEKAKDQRAVALASLDLANVHIGTGELDKGVEYCQRAAQTLEASKDLYEASRAWNNLGAAYYQKKKFKKARKCAERCLQISRSLGGIRAQAYAECNLSEIQAREKDYKGALESCGRSLRVFKRLGDRKGKSAAYEHYGIVYKLLGDWENARLYFEKSIQVAKELATPYHLALRYFEFAMMYLAKGDKKLAREYLEKSLKIFTRIGAERYAKRVKKEFESLF